MSIASMLGSEQGAGVRLQQPMPDRFESLGRQETVAVVSRVLFALSPLHTSNLLLLFCRVLSMVVWM